MNVQWPSSPGEESSLIKIFLSTSSFQSMGIILSVSGPVLYFIVADNGYQICLTQNHVKINLIGTPLKGMYVRVLSIFRGNLL